MGERLGDLFLTKPRTLKRGNAPARAIAARASDTAPLDAGVWASFGTAAFVGVIAVGLKVGEGLPTAPDSTPRAPEPVTTLEDFGRIADLPLAEVEAPNLAQPIAYRPAATRPSDAITAFPSLPVQTTHHEEAPALGDPLAAYLSSEMPPAVISEVAYVPATIDIHRPRFGDRETVLQVASRRAPIDPGGLRDAANSLLQSIAMDWEAPRTREVSFFVASGDEQISWSLSDASPNHGAVAYQDARVEVGEASAGIALSMDGAQVALAHVQTQDVSFWGQRQEEDYSGVILTMKF